MYFKSFHIKSYFSISRHTLPNILTGIFILMLSSICMANDASQVQPGAQINNPVLRVVGWDVYADPRSKNKTIGYKEFEKKYGVTIEFTPLSNLDDIITATESNLNYDVIIISNEGIQILAQMGLTIPLELNKLPNFQDLYPSLKSNKWIKHNDHITAIPWAWGPTGLLFDTKTVAEPNSWNILWDEKYQGKVALWNDVSMIWTTALTLGYKNIYNLTKQQLTKVKQKLFKLNNQVYNYYDGGNQAEEYINQGSVRILNSWYDPSARLRKKGHQLKMIIPKEGAVGMFDSYLISSSSKNNKLAHQYINFQINPNTQKKMFNVTGLVPANSKTKNLLNKEEINFLPTNEENYFKKMILWDVMPRKHLYENVLKEVKEDLQKKIKASAKLKLTASEKKWLTENPSVTFTGDPNWLPYESFKKDGTYIGIVSEHLKLISGLTGLTFKMSPSNSWTESTEKAKQGFVDVLSETDDSELSSHLNFTTPYISNPIVIAMSSKQNYVENINSIKNKKIALIKNYGYTSKIRKKYSDINFISVDNIQSGLLAVSTGSIDALLCTHALCSYTITELGLNDVRITGKTEFDTKLALGVQKNLHELKSILNKAIAQITPAEQQVIFNKWIQGKYVEKINYTLVYQIISVTILLVLIFLFLNRRLERVVRERTQELITARDDAQLANASKTEFLSRMSHELRTPMNAILGFSQILHVNYDKHLSAVELESVNEILTAGYHLLDLINEVLDLSQAESGDLKIKIENIEFSTIIDECVSLVKPIADKSEITISRPNFKEPIYIKADRIRIKQIIINLLANAIKYNNEKGEIEVNYEIRGSKLTLSIKDTGIGIPEELHARVFKPFDRLNAFSTSIEGTGIGLTLAKKLIELMDGNIGFDSAERKGSTFWIEMNLGTKYFNQNAAIQADHEEIESDKNCSILYVEDNPANLRLVSNLLKKQKGVTLYDAHNGALALDLLSSTNNFSLILLDIQLPGDINGFDILKKIRTNSKNPNVPVIAISANATEHDINEGLNAGFDDYITKPINIGNFMITINLHLKEKME